MFSWSKKSSNHSNSHSNNPKQPLHDECAETKESHATPTSTPSPAHYPLHAAVLHKDADSLQRHLASLPSVDPLLPDKMKPINQLDHHGYTALHLCVFLAWDDGVDLLLEHGASPTVRRYVPIRPCIVL